MIKKAADENEACRRLVAIPGIGPVTATAIVAAIGNGAAFKKGRGFSAWLGIVPGEYTTGGKQKLLGISKRDEKAGRSQVGSFVFSLGKVFLPPSRHCRHPSIRTLP